MDYRITQIERSIYGKFCSSVDQLFHNDWAGLKKHTCNAGEACHQIWEPCEHELFARYIIWQCINSTGVASKQCMFFSIGNNSMHIMFLYCQNDRFMSVSISNTIISTNTSKNDVIAEIYIHIAVCITWYQLSASK